MDSTHPSHRWWKRQVRVPDRLVAAAARFAVPVALSSWALAGASLAFGFTVPGAALRDPLLGPLSRARLAAGEFLLACAAAAVFWALARAVGPVLPVPARGASPLETEKRRRFLLAAAGVSLAALYFASWGVFWGTGTFLDRSVLQFTAANPGQMLKHLLSMNPVATVGLPLSAAMTIAMLRFAPLGRIPRTTDRTRRRIAAAFLATVVAGAAVALVGGFVSEGRTRVVVEPSGVKTTEGRLFRHALGHRAAPLLHLWSSAVHRPAALGTRLQLPDVPGQPDVEVEPRHQLPLNVWAAAVTDRPATSVVVLLVESLRPDALRQFGGPREVMPALDELAAQSLRFQRAYAQASHSDYADLCPLASQYPLREKQHHLYPSPLTYPRVLLYELLGTLGYRTAIVSSQNETWGNMHNYLASERLDHFFDSRSRSEASVVDEEDLNFASWVKDFGLAGKLDDRVTVDEAIRWIGESDRPFFMYVNLQNSHFPYRLPEGFPARFSPHVVDFPYTFANYPADKVEVVRNRYDNALAYVDAQIARLLDFLRDTGRLDRTILVVSGDTGQAFMEHGVSGHAGPLYEEVVRVPLLVRAPGVSPRDVRTLAEHVDVPPTILGMLGLPTFPGFQGDDLARGTDDQAFLVAQTPRANQFALVAGRHKLIYDLERERYLLFDVVGDPAEREDLADREPALRRALAGRLQVWLDAQLGYYANPQATALFYPPAVVPAKERSTALLAR